jgi:5'-nucleotidase
MKILLSNDDGVHAPGLLALYQAVSDLGQVSVFAPDRNCSAYSQALTLKHPIRIQTISQTGFIAVEGTPTDSVHLAMGSGLIERPDLILSGINQGANLGDDVLYSGTVAAAMEGNLFGVSAMAISLVSQSPKNYAVAGRVIRNLVQQIISGELDLNLSFSKILWNINIPDCEWHELKGLKVCRLGNRHRAQAMVETQSPRNEKLYWVGLPGLEQDTGPDTDFDAIKNNWISITPLRINLTDDIQLTQTRRLLSNGILG